MQGTLDVPVELFEGMLHSLYENLQHFSQTLDEEKALLEKNKSDELTQNLDTKRLLIEALDKISAQCGAFLGSQTNPFNERQMDSIIAQYPANKQLYLRNLWQEIRTLLKTCNKKNLVNGVMITTLKNYNDNMLHILTRRPKEDVYSNQVKKSQLAVSTREHKA